jgi:uncharacterized protein (DUF58 family)
MAQSPAITSLIEPELLTRLERLAILAKRTRVGTTKGERRSKRKGSSIEFADYRTYVQGDDLRHVDWNIYSRLEHLYLKLFMEQEDLTVHLLVDASASMNFGTPSKITFAGKLAAAIGYIALCSYDRVSCEAFAGHGGQRLQPCRGKSSARRLFEFIQRIEPGGTTSLEESCKQYALRHRTKGVAILFSDFFDQDGHEGALRRLLTSGSDCYAIHVLAPEEVNPPIKGDLRLIDSETEEYTEISVSPALLKKYRENVRGFREEIQKYCRARNITYIPATTDTPLETLTLQVLRRGGLVQ